MKIPFLIGDKLYLRPLEKTDINGNYVSWLNDAEICQFNSHHFFQYSKEKAEDYIAKVNRSSSEIVLAIVCKENDLHIDLPTLFRTVFNNEKSKLCPRIKKTITL